MICIPASTVESCCLSNARACLAISFPTVLYCGTHPPTAQCPIPIEVIVKAGILGFAIIIEYVAFRIK